MKGTLKEDAKIFFTAEAQRKSKNSLTKSVGKGLKSILLLDVLCGSAPLR
jgi:hypothetical protein